MPLTDDMRNFLDERRFAVLATINPDGSPQQTVMWYQLRGDHVIVNTAAGRLKDMNVRRDPRASICVEDEYRYVTISGKVDFVEDHETTQADIYGLARRYNPDFKDGDYAVFATQKRVTLRISIDRVVANGFS